MTLKAKREPKLVAAGLALVLGCAALGAALSRRQAEKVGYLELARAVPAGGVIRTADLTSASMSPPGNLGVIPVSRASEVLGTRAAGTLVAGSLLVTADLLRGSPPPSRSALVGTSLQPDQAPAGLAVGDAVLVVFAGGSSAQAPAASGATGVIGRGTVFSLAPGATSGGAQVTVAVPPAEAAAVATASATGNVSLVELPQGAP